MLVARTDPFTGKTNTMDLDITDEQVHAFCNGTLVQNAFPHLTPDELAFILTGITPESWEEAFGSDE